MALVLLVLGAALTVAGTAFIFWPAALIVGGVVLLAAGIDMGRDSRPSGPEVP